jgi:hypothetical protein
VQDLGLFGVLGHSIHLSLQLLSSDRALPVILQGLGIVQIIRHFLFQLCLRHHRIERRLGILSLLWPDSVTPVHFFDRSLIRHTLFERERSFGSFRGCFRTEGGRQRSSRDQKAASQRRKKLAPGKLRKPDWASGFLLHCRWMNFEPPLVA